MVKPYVKMNKDGATEELIKQAARVVFTSKGFDGARMQDIADQANVNKGLLNYYFRSKEKLFNLIFDEAFNDLFSNTAKILKADISLEEKIKAIIENESKTIIENPYLPLFVLNEVSRNQHIIQDKINSTPVKAILSNFSSQVAKEVKAGKIRKITGEELFINITSLLMLPFIAENLFSSLFDYKKTEFNDRMRKRQKEVTDFILHSIRK
jgi:AcrR family transcriptional regulator